MKTKAQMKRLNTRRLRKAHHVRRRIRQHQPARPRLSVYRSNKHISCQVIDDATGRTLAAASSLDKELRALKGSGEGIKKAEMAAKVGARIAERSKAAGVTKVAFDRACYKYHGRVKALAEAAREGGLEF